MGYYLNIVFGYYFAVQFYVIQKRPGLEESDLNKLKATKVVSNFNPNLGTSSHPLSFVTI